MPTSHITPDMEAVIGREFDRRNSFPICASDVRRWATAVYYPEPPPRMYWDRGSGTGADGEIVAPHEFNPFAWMTPDGPTPTTDASEHDPNRPFTMQGVTGPELTFQVNGGIEVTYGVPMKIGDVITSSTHVAEIRERAGRLGLMLFTTTETVLTNQDGEEVRRERMTIIRY